MAPLRRMAAVRSVAATLARLTVAGAGIAAAPTALPAGLLAEPVRAAARLGRAGVETTSSVAEASC